MNGAAYMMEDTYIIKEVNLDYPQGLNLFLSRQIAKCAARFNAEVRIRVAYGVADASDPLGLMALGIEHQSLMTLEADGDDADAAVQAIAEQIFCAGLKKEIV